MIDDVYSTNSQIPIYGTVSDWENNTVPDFDVEVAVFVMGTKRTLQTQTNSLGEFSVVFEPLPFESGYYTVNSGRVGNNSTEVHDEFNIPGLTVATTDNILCEVILEQPRTDSILIRNKSNVPLHNIQLEPLQQGQAGGSMYDTYTMESALLDLGGLEEGYLVYTIVGTAMSEDNYYEQLKFLATSDEGAATVIPIWYYCVDRRPL